MKKKLLVSSLIVFGIVGIQAPAFAATTSDISTPTPPAIETVQSVTEKAPVSFEVRLSKLITAGTKSVNDRLAKLGALKTKIQSGKLTDTQKQTLTSSIDSEVTALNTVLANIKAATSTASVKALNSSVFADYRVYGVFIPQIKLLSNAYAQENHFAKLDAVFAKAQSRIDAQKSKGTDVSGLQANLDSAKAISSSLSSQLSDIETKTNALKPADYPTVSKATIKAINESIKSISASFKKINSLVKAKTKVV